MIGNLINMRVRLTLLTLDLSSSTEFMLLIITVNAVNVLISL